MSVVPHGLKRISIVAANGDEQRQQTLLDCMIEAARKDDLVPPPPARKAATTPKRRVRTGQATTARVTLAQVAARAGVSTTAASFVLSGRDDQRIAPATQERVRKAAEDLGYRPNLTARTLRTGTSGTIALVSDYVSSTPYASDVLRGALEAARRHDMLLYIAESLGDEDVEQRLLQGLADRGVDAVIYAAMFTRRIVVPDLVRKMPLVLLNCVSDDVTAAAVLPDEVGAGREAAQLLIDAGHRSGIHFVGHTPPGFRGGIQWKESEPLALPQRLSGVESALAEAGLALSATPPLDEWEPANGRLAVKALLAAGAAPRALICINDRVAFGAYQALQAAGLSVPEDVSVVSFDGSELAGWLEPGLTSLALPHEEMGRTAVDTLFTKSPPPGSRRLVPMPVHSRGSVGPARP